MCQRLLTVSQRGYVPVKYVPGTDELLAKLPLCPTGLTLDGSSSRCSGVVSVPALKKCAAVLVGSSVVLRDGKCVMSSVSVRNPVVSCFATTEDPLSWVFDSGSGQCVATVFEDYEVKTGERRVPPLTERVRVAPFTKRVRVAPFSESYTVTERVRVAPFTKQKRVAPFREKVRVAPFTRRERVAPFTKRVRVAPFNRQVRVAPFSKQVRVPPFSVRVRVAPFTERVSVRESYSYTVRERSSCNEYLMGRCLKWNYRIVRKTGYRTVWKTVPAYNYETRSVVKYNTVPVYNYETRAVYNYETVPNYKYESVPVYNYEWRAVFNYETESVENYENRQVTKTREVFNYEDQEVFNYEDREVLNFEPVYETRQRKVEKRKPPELLCSDGHIIDRNDNKFKKKVETVTSTVNSCDGTSKASLRSVLGTSLSVTYTNAEWSLGGGKCHRSVTTPPVGCDTGYKLLRLREGSICRHPKASPFGAVDIAARKPILGFAPDSVLTYHADEDDDAERKQWESYFILGGEQVYNSLTDLSIRKAKKEETPDVK